MSRRQRNRKRRAQQIRQGADEPQRPPAPVVEWTFEFTCLGCGHTVNRTIGQPGQPIEVRLPHLCPDCRRPAPFRESRSARILNLEDYPSIEGIRVQVRGESPTGPVLRRLETVDAIYRETGEPFRYQRLYDHENDIYWKRYTNRNTGEVEIESTERLSEHRGRGAARPKPTTPEAVESVDPSPPTTSRPIQ